MKNQKTKDVREIRKLEVGQSYTIPESDYGKADICKTDNGYKVYLIPLYGGEPDYYGTYQNVEQIVELVYQIA